MFSWDIRKATSNFEKHAVSFEEAATVFVDPEALDFDDAEHSKNEKRFKHNDSQNYFRRIRESLLPSAAGDK